MFDVLTQLGVSNLTWTIASADVMTQVSEFLTVLTPIVILGLGIKYAGKIKRMVLG